MDRTRDNVIDELLVTRCQQGSREAFDWLMRRWQRPLWRYARRLTGSPDEAWDVTQDAWLAILRQIRRLRDPAWFAAWAHRIVRNKCADHVRRAGRRRQLADTLAADRRLDDEPYRDDTKSAVADTMRQLPAEQRELLALRYGGDLNLLEIALVLGLPVGTVKSRLHQARQHMKRILQGANHEPARR